MNNTAITTTTAMNVTSTSNRTISCVKVAFNGELRRFPFPIDSSDDQFNVLARTISKSFGVPRASISLQYVDDENDVITIGSQLELLAAISTAASSILRINVLQRAIPAASSMTACGDATKSASPLPATTAAATATTSATTPMPMHPPCGRFGGGAWRRHGAFRKCGGEQLQEQYREQLQALNDEGLHCGFWAVRVLASVNGDLAAARQIIVTRRAAMQQLRQKYASELAALESAGIIVPETADEATIGGGSDAGAHNHCVRKCIRLLERFGGDVSQVVAHVRAKETERAQLPHRFASQLEQLRAQGFTCEPVCLRLLHKLDGNVTKVAERMHKFRKAACTRPDGSNNTTNNNSDAEVEYSEQLQQLTSNGFPRPMCLRLLRKFDGNVTRVERALQLRKQWFNDTTGTTGMGEKRQQFKQAKKRFGSEIAQLKEMGFRCKWLMVPLLLQHNGDVAAVSMALAQL